MTLKKFGALLLAGAMMTGTIGVMSPTQVKAATPASTYTMTVPANMDIEKSGWNSLSDIQISGSVDSIKKVTVTATTTNGFKLMDAAGNSVSYTMKTKENGSEQKSFEFDAASINEGRASQTIGVYVEDFAGKPAGTYTDTIQFTAEGLLWEEADCLYIELEDDTNNYVVILENIGFCIYELNNIAPCEINGDWENAVPFDLKIDGNVFTLTSKDEKADFDITINFSNKDECRITRNASTYDLMCVYHQYRTGGGYYLVGNGNNLEP